MALNFLRRKDGSWNVPLIMALVVAALAVVGGGYAVYYMTYSRRKARRFVVTRAIPAREAFKHMDKPSYQVDMTQRPVLIDGKFYMPGLEEVPKGAAPFSEPFETLSEFV